MFFLLKNWIRDRITKLILSLFFSWVYDNSIKPITDIFYGQLENEGFFFVAQAKRMGIKEIVQRTIEAKDIFVLYKDLPTTDHVMYYEVRDDYTPYLKLMHIGACYLHQKEKSATSFLAKQEYLRQKEVIDINMKIYDLMDDLRRPYIWLYTRRIKLAQLKELTGSDDYYNIKIPPIIPPEFFPPYREP